MNSLALATRARRLTVCGRVQGVGYRPFVYRLAHRLGVSGWVLNASGEVEILAEAPPQVLDIFERALVDEAPPLARPQLKQSDSARLEGSHGFSIRESHESDRPDIHVPPDQFACDDCIDEMNASTGHRYRYPFINCTQCGPRYTIIRAMPYDRPNTTMRDFPLCPTCGAEYSDPLDRRFHAQPLACPTCGPALRYVDNGEVTTGNEQSLDQCVAAIESGKIVAVKGIGGYHLVCDATNEIAVARLRTRKHRPAKPLAIMVPWRGSDGMEVVRELSLATPLQMQTLADATRPIVLVSSKPGTGLAPSIAPGLDEVGMMLPYSPLHHLLLDAWGGPIVATSGNISGEPVITDPDEAESRLAQIADTFLHHNRPIQRPADDPVIREIAGVARPIRLGRGNAPLELALPFELAEPILATGAYLKNTIALAWRNRVVISPHIGDLSSRRAREVFSQVAADLQALYGVKAESLACDAHPGYASHHWAKASGQKFTPIFHHRAHASALAGEYDVDIPMIVFTWDGVGLGEDGNLWGGEALVGRPGEWRHGAGFRHFSLPGGDRAVHEPWRTALSLCWACGIDWPDAPEYPALLRQAWQKKISNPLTSAVGRLFDAAAAFAGIVTQASYEGEGPTRLEAVMEATHDFIELPIAEADDGVLRADWAPLVSWLATVDVAPAIVSGVFHESMSQSLLRQAQCLQERHGIRTIGLAGGVFQNRRLTTRCCDLLTAAGFDVRVPRLLPANDAAISYGQVIELAMQTQRGNTP
ncbi:MAG TPA: carbamoyltransferase HypF [Pseudomonadales bacterium]|nr:carbamoyltransferase HypF [Pseudomonadales bacterium]